MKAYHQITAPEHVTTRHYVDTNCISKSEHIDIGEIPTGEVLNRSNKPKISIFRVAISQLEYLETMNSEGDTYWGELIAIENDNDPTTTKPDIFNAPGNKVTAELAYRGEESITYIQVAQENVRGLLAALAAKADKTDNLPFNDWESANFTAKVIEDTTDTDPSLHFRTVQVQAVLQDKNKFLASSPTTDNQEPTFRTIQEEDIPATTKPLQKSLVQYTNNQALETLPTGYAHVGGSVYWGKQEIASTLFPSFGYLPPLYLTNVPTSTGGSKTCIVYFLSIGAASYTGVYVVEDNIWLLATVPELYNIGEYTCVSNAINNTFYYLSTMTNIYFRKIEVALQITSGVVSAANFTITDLANTYGTPAVPIQNIENMTWKGVLINSVTSVTYIGKGNTAVHIKYDVASNTWNTNTLAGVPTEISTNATIRATGNGGTTEILFVESPNKVYQYNIGSSTFSEFTTFAPLPYEGLAPQIIGIVQHYDFLPTKYYLMDKRGIIYELERLENVWNVPAHPLFQANQYDQQYSVPDIQWKYGMVYDPKRHHFYTKGVRVNPNNPTQKFMTANKYSLQPTIVLEKT